MAGFNYARSQKTADKLITKFGGTGNLMKMTKVDGRPTYQAYPVKMVVLDYETDEVDGTRISAKDRKIYVSARGLTVDILPVDRIRDTQGVEYEIIAPVKPLNPSGATVVYFEIQGRI